MQKKSSWYEPKQCSLQNVWCLLGTVAMVELMDIAFSVDSVLAAFGVSNEVWILLLGGMLGILMMRGIAGVFLKLLERIPELETTAYILILIIAAKYLLSVIHIEISHHSVLHYFSCSIWSNIYTSLHEEFWTS